MKSQAWSPIILGVVFAGVLLVLLVACTPNVRPTPTPAPARSPTTAPVATAATATPKPSPAFVYICNTGGMGAYIRTEPDGAGILAWPDGTRLQIAGADRNVSGAVWRNVQDEKGTVGWIKADYLRCATGTATVAASPTQAKPSPTPTDSTSPTRAPACTDPNKPRAPSKAPPSSNCYIKGNISEGGEKIYHLPAQQYYEQTVIEERKGERWFRTTEEAEAAGWRRSKV